MAEINQTPAVTFMLEYTKARSNYLDYTLRETATVQEGKQLSDEAIKEMLGDIHEAVPQQSMDFKQYVDYTIRSYATQIKEEHMTPFNQHSLELTSTDLERLRQQLDTATRNHSLLWQGVISFDHQFLVEHGLYEPKTKAINQEGIKRAVQEAMKSVLNREGLEQAFWWGDLHLNTKHLHVHVGISEEESKRPKIMYEGELQPKGNFSDQSLKVMKRLVYNRLLSEKTKNHQILLEQSIDESKNWLIKHSSNYFVLQDRQFLIEQLVQNLPEKGKWRYGSHAKEFAIAKFYMDKYIDVFLSGEGQALYQKFNEDTRELLKEYEQAYTANEKRTYEKYKMKNGRKVHSKRQETTMYPLDRLVNQREKELRERVGNHILRYLNEHPIEELLVDNNIGSFSSLNQQAIRRQYPTATYIKTEEMWQEEGRIVLDTAKEIEITVPIFELDENGNPTKKLRKFDRGVYYDVQDTKVVEHKRKLKRPSIKELCTLSSEELVQLIELMKQVNEPEQHKQVLGIYKYALRLRLIEEEIHSLKENQVFLRKVTPCEADQPYVSFQKAYIGGRLKLLALQKKPKRQLTKNEKARKEELLNTYFDVSGLAIDHLTAERIATKRQLLKTEQRFTRQVVDGSLIQQLSGLPKEKRLKQLALRVEMLKAKEKIFKNNQRLQKIHPGSTTAQQLRKENGQYFNQLKRLYAQEDLLLGKPNAADCLNQLSDRFFQAPKRKTVSANFIQELNAAVVAGSRKDIQAMRKKARNDARILAQEEREEQEEKQRGHSI